MLNKKVLLGGAAGYLIALITSPIVPEYLTLLIPYVGLVVGGILHRTSKPKVNIAAEVLPAETTAPVIAPTPPTSTAPAPTPPVQAKAEVTGVDPEFVPVLEYLDVLGEMVISEGQKHNLDDEIVDKSLAVFSRLQRVVPMLQGLNNGNLNHEIRRLVLKDLDGFMTPFLRLSGENKTKNRRTVLNGLKDINSKITSIVETIEHKDLIELQTKADLIHSRYHESDRY